MREVAIQYLESPLPAGLKPAQARACLRTAFEHVPVQAVLIGWGVPDAILQACAEETRQHGASLYRWHSLLSGDGVFLPRLAWRTIGLEGEPVGGFRGLDEFTFVCPNHPEGRAAVLEHLQLALSNPCYQGVFLDRMRYPSPAVDPISDLACFCPHCQLAAAREGLDLEAVRRLARNLAAEPDGCRRLVKSLLGNRSLQDEGDLVLLQAFLDFRQRSITRLVQSAAEVARSCGMAVGLDCFSPALTRLVGQDLTALDACCDWIKIMSYGHTLGPAGLPFELLGLCDWLTRKGVSETSALANLSDAAALLLPARRDLLHSQGLASQAIESEIRHARAAGVRRLWVGVALVDMPQVNPVSDEQITADLDACREAGANGFALAWDLWHIPPQRLDSVRCIL